MLNLGRRLEALLESCKTPGADVWGRTWDATVCEHKKESVRHEFRVPHGFCLEMFGRIRGKRAYNARQLRSKLRQHLYK